MQLFLDEKLDYNNLPGPSKGNPSRGSSLPCPGWCQGCWSSQFPSRRTWAVRKKWHQNSKLRKASSLAISQAKDGLVRAVACRARGPRFDSSAIQLHANSEMATKNRTLDNSNCRFHEVSPHLETFWGSITVKGYVLVTLNRFIQNYIHGFPKKCSMLI